MDTHTEGRYDGTGEAVDDDKTHIKVEDEVDAESGSEYEAESESESETDFGGANEDGKNSKNTKNNSRNDGETKDLVDSESEDNSGGTTKLRPCCLNCAKLYSSYPAQECNPSQQQTKFRVQNQNSVRGCLECRAAGRTCYLVPEELQTELDILQTCASAYLKASPATLLRTSRALLEAQAAFDAKRLTLSRKQLTSTLPGEGVSEYSAPKRHGYQTALPPVAPNLSIQSSQYLATMTCIATLKAVLRVEGETEFLAWMSKDFVCEAYRNLASTDLLLPQLRHLDQGGSVSDPGAPILLARQTQWAKVSHMASKVVRRIDPEHTADRAAQLDVNASSENRTWHFVRFVVTVARGARETGEVWTDTTVEESCTNACRVAAWVYSQHGSNQEKKGVGHSAAQKKRQKERYVVALRTAARI